MATCHRHNPTNLAAVVLDNHHSSTSLCSSFSRSSFRRKLLHSLRCGGGCSDKPKHKPLPNNDSRSDPTNKNDPGSDKLSELLRLSEEEEDEVKKKTKVLDEFKCVVKRLQCDDVLWGAKEIRRLTKEDPHARTTLALLGSIPTLVAMLDCKGNDVEFQISALYALLNLGIANPENKAAIVKAGAVHKMLKLVDSSDELPDQSVAEAIVANFLGLSALDVNKPIIGSSGAIPFLVKMLKDVDSSGGSQAKQDTLRALYNLSISPSNILPMLETDVVQFFVSSLGDMEVSERILLIMSNVVSTLEGRKAVSSVQNVFPILIDALSWNDSPGCQEIASYILMVMAHKSYVDRQAMTEAGIVSALLELTLIGSNLAQKRASRILECLRVDKGKQVSENCVGGSGGTLSAPLCGASPSFADPHLQECPDEDDMMSEEKKAVKHLVQQSLHNNMRRIVKRANLPQDFVPSDHLKSLTSSSTSKSLPF
ncbi:U-box domain-containing protein 45-like [Apium graveolens]|uniref:U-box domain-containing protein 45-like n=1 Tax=Apium graveolens TaxID=4045 RepID=UPI003D78C765